MSIYFQLSNYLLNFSHTLVNRLNIEIVVSKRENFFNFWSHTETGTPTALINA